MSMADTASQWIRVRSVLTERWVEGAKDRSSEGLKLLKEVGVRSQCG